MKIIATIDLSDDSFERVNAETLTITSGELTFCDSLKTDLEIALDDLNVSYKLNIRIDNKISLASALFLVTSPHVWADLVRGCEESVASCSLDTTCPYCSKITEFLIQVAQVEGK